MRRRPHPEMVLLGCVLLAVGVAAHPLTFTDTTLTLAREGTFDVDMVVDLDALALGAPQDTDDAELVAALEAVSAEEFDTLVRRLATLFERRVRVRFDGRPVPVEVTFPDYGTSRATDSVIPTVLGVTARLTGVVPDQATDVSFFASRAFSDVHLTIVDEIRGTRSRTVLERGARSDPHPLTGPEAPSSGLGVAGEFLRLGFVHIVPRGLDHILFVLGLFLLSRRLRPLVWQVTAFTLAHALTLALGALNIVSVSPGLVEPLIAASITWVAIENVLTAESTLRPWRPVVVFGFGLLHGLGFAQVLTGLGLPDGEWLVALAAFNGGIELGQLTVIGVAGLTVGGFRHRPWYRRRVVVPGSLAIALVGLVWTIERTLA